MQHLTIERPERLNFDEIDRAVRRGRRMRSDAFVGMARWLWRSLTGDRRRTGGAAGDLGGRPRHAAG